MEKEFMDIHDINGNKTGKTILRGEKLDKGDYALYVNVVIKNSENKFLLQQRHSSKTWYPNAWSLSGGGVLAGETDKQAIVRELLEELNINLSNQELHKKGRVIANYGLIDIWIVYMNIDLNQVSMQHNEVSDVKFVDKQEMLDLVSQIKTEGQDLYLEILSEL